MPTPRSAAALHPVCRQDLPDWSSASAGARRSRPTYNTASLFLSCTHADLHLHTNVSSWLQCLGVIPPLSVKPQVRGTHQSHIDVEHWSNTDAVKLAIITMGLGISEFGQFNSLQLCFCLYRLQGCETTICIRSEEVWLQLHTPYLQPSVRGVSCLPLVSNISASRAKCPSHSREGMPRGNQRPHFNQKFLSLWCVFVCPAYL